MPEYYLFPCGCQLPIIGYKKNGKPKLYINFDSSHIDDLRLDCPAVWEAYREGRTKCTFQTESNLGKQWAKKIKPENVEQLAALVSLIRPVTLKSFDEKGVNMTSHYAKRKNNEEDVEYFHPFLEPILKDTFGIACFQEQLMKITQVLAGFNAQDADSFRKATGKKDAKLMTEVKHMFFDGCRKTGILTEQEMEEMWYILEKANRYSFNKSHAQGYALTSYQTMYAKVHLPHETILSYLHFADEKMDAHREVRELISEARMMNIPIRPPALVNKNSKFKIVDDVIYFGLTDIKGVGDAQVKKLKRAVAEAEMKIGPVKSWNWFDFLIHISSNVNSTVVKNLITCGALNFSISRTRMLFEYENIWSKLTGKEQEYCYNIGKGAAGNEQSTLTNILKVMVESGKGTANKNRLKIVSDLYKLLTNPPFPLHDAERWIATKEEELLGVALTCSKSGIRSRDMATATCKDFLNGRRGNMSLAVDIAEIREYKIKKGQNQGQTMAFLVIEDETCSLDTAVVFSESFSEHSDILFAGNSVLVEGIRSRDRDDSFIINKAYQI